ncbi:hypothetical protein ACM66B_004734 [Microbotryomycetes sp. NB124-2]
MRFVRAVLTVSCLAAFAVAVRAHDLSGPSHHKRQSSGQADTSTSYLPAIISSATSKCTEQCQDVSRAVGSCISQGNGNEAQIALCACSQQTLGVIKHCVTCTTNDPENKSGSTPLSYYNGFVNQCISLSAASGNDLVSISGQQVTTAQALTSLDTASASILAPAVLSSGLKALTAVTSAASVSAPSGMSRAPVTSSTVVATSLGANATPSAQSTTKPSSGNMLTSPLLAVVLSVAFVVQYLA